MPRAPIHEADGVAGEKSTILARGQSLSELPIDLVIAATVTEIDVSNNRLAVLPDAIVVRLSNLQRLNISHNMLTSLPAAIAGLCNLEHLDVRWNLLSSLPAGLGTTASAALQLFATPQLAGSTLTLSLPARTSPTLYRDTDFPANSSALFRNPLAPWSGHPAADNEGVRWLRPFEICKAAGPNGGGGGGEGDGGGGGDGSSGSSSYEPALFVGNSDSSDVVQGLLGDCWLLSAIAVVAQRPELLRHIFAYAAVEGARPGSLTLQLWEDGAWRRVTIDDRLPCGRDGQLLYARSLEPNEMCVMPLPRPCALPLPRARTLPLSSPTTPSFSSTHVILDTSPSSSSADTSPSSPRTNAHQVGASAREGLCQALRLIRGAHLWLCRRGDEGPYGRVAAAAATCNGKGWERRCSRRGRRSRWQRWR